MRAIVDPRSPEVTRHRWRHKRRRLLRVLLYLVLIAGAVELCALAVRG